MKNKLTKNEIISEAVVMESKYFDLVWYARSSPNSDKVPGVLENRKRIEELFPDEIEDLCQNDDSRIWEHGFNSGMLAGMRYIIDLFESGKEYAEDNFPLLDS